MEKLTDEQIIKALECCGKGFGNCEGCPYDDENNDCVTNDGKTLIFQDTLDLIKRQQAEIKKLTVKKNAFGRALEIEAAEVKRLQDYNENLQTANTALSNEILDIKSEAIKEFAERLKKEALKHKIFPFDSCVDFDDINNLVEEMVGAL